MKQPRADNQEGLEGQEGQNTCPKCGKRIAASAEEGALSPNLPGDLECACGTKQGQFEGNTGGKIESGSESETADKTEDKTEAKTEKGHITKTQPALTKFPSEESVGKGDMPKQLSQLRRTHEGITFTRPGVTKSATGTIGLMDGATIGGIYRISKRIGRGAMGEVYLAEHIMLGKICALKVIPPEQVTDESWQRFQIEAKAVAMLDHGNLVKVSDLGIHAGCLPFYAMEYVEGETLEELLVDQKTLPLNTALEIFIQVCDGLGYAHRHGIVHRDLKPANIILATGPIGQDSVKVLDFGLAKLTQPDKRKQRLTSVGDIFGSPPYMSPEQCRGDKTDQRSDIYSLGCTLFECLTGRTPFTGNLATTLLYNHQKVEAPSLESIAGPNHFPKTMEVVMAKLLQKDPLERYQSMAEVRRDLELLSRGEDILQFHVSGSEDAAATLRGSRGKIAIEKDLDNNLAKDSREEKEDVKDSSIINKPPMIVWSLVALLIIGLVGAYWFYTQHKDCQYAALPVLMTGAGPASINDTTPFSSSDERNGRRFRRFNFPVDVIIGQIRSASNLVVPSARGQIEFPDTDSVYFLPNSILTKYPGYLKRFRPGDIYAVSIENSDKSDALLGAAGAIPGVEKLRVYRCQSLTSEGLKNVQNYDHLVDLDCSYNKTDVANISNISRLKELKNIRLSGERNVDPVIKGLAHSDKIKELSLDDCQICPELLTIIASLPKLTTLSLNADNLTDQDLMILSKSASLRFLSILKTPITPKTATIIKSFRALKVLQIVAEPNAQAVSGPQLLDLRRSLPHLKVY